MAALRFISALGLLPVFLAGPAKAAGVDFAAGSPSFVVPEPSTITTVGLALTIGVLVVLRRKR